MTPGINSSTKSPPASFTIEIKKVLVTTAGVMLAPRIVGNRECRRRGATPDPGEVDLVGAVISTANQRLDGGAQPPMDYAALAYPVVAWILMKGGGDYSVRENSHAGGAQQGCAELLAKSSGTMAILGICIEELLIAGGVKCGKQRNGPGNLREGEHHFVHGGKVLRCLFGLNNLRVFTCRRHDSNRHLVSNRRKW